MSEHIRMTDACPGAGTLSAHLDEQLDDRERAHVDGHLRNCRACGEAFATMRSLRAELRALPDPTLGVDLSGAIEGRLAALPSRQPTRASKHRGGRFIDWLPVGAAAAASLTLGLAMGFGLTVGSGLTAGPGLVTAPRVSAMAVFDPIAPGGVCIGLDACYGDGGGR